jgi:hypothetical protein
MGKGNILYLREELNMGYGRTGREQNGLKLMNMKVFSLVINDSYIYMQR